MKKWLSLTMISLAGLCILFTCTDARSESSVMTDSNLDEADLNWKVAEGDSIVYLVNMSEIGESEFKANFEGIFNEAIREKAGSAPESLFNRLMEDFVELGGNIKTVLSPSPDFDGVVDVRMSYKPEESEDDSNNPFAALKKGVMLRGSVYETGGVHSFWLKSEQRNLLSMLFELPEKPVRIGEIWSLKNVNLISLDQHFICKKANSKNEVSLKAIKELEGEPIAIVEYSISQSAEGIFNMPAFPGSSGSPKATPTSMEFSFAGKGEFALEQGRWLSFKGLMKVSGSGIMQMNSKQRFVMKLEE